MCLHTSPDDLDDLWLFSHDFRLRCIPSGHSGNGDVNLIGHSRYSYEPRNSHCTEIFAFGVSLVE